MNQSKLSQAFQRPFVRDYGMVFVLMLLVVLFSALTVNLQHPSGEAAGRLVADTIVEEHGDTARVIVVGRDTAEDRKFTTAVAERLKESGVNVLDVVNGSAIDVRKSIQAIVDSGQGIDAIAANDVTAKWAVYDQFRSIESAQRVTPRPYLWPDFLKLSNLTGVANQTAIYAIIAIGMTMVIITAGIDLSVGSLVALAAVISSLIVRDMGGGVAAGISTVVLSSIAGLSVCALAGAYHGVLITVFRVPSFVVTLGMMMVARGAARWLSDGESISQLPESYFWLGGGKLLGIPNPILLMAVLYLVAHFVMARSVFGRYVYAIGGNEEAARLSGVPVRRVIIVVYTICGALAGLGGIVLASQLGAGDPKYGDMYELEVIAAVVVGGTSLMGGQGKVFGTLIGAFIIAVIKNGMNLIGLDPDLQLIVLGGVLTLAVILDAIKRRAGS
jgi:ribose transport system permease protein